MVAVTLVLLGPLASALAGPSPQRTVRVRWAHTGNPNGASGEPSLTGDGRQVVFSTAATNLSPRQDANGHVRDIYLYDQGTGELRMVSEALKGGADGPSSDPIVASSGPGLAFVSEATNLVPDDTNGAPDVFVVAPGGGLARVSVSPEGKQVDGGSGQPDLSADGRLLVFTSTADNLLPGDGGGRADVFVRDLLTGATTLVSATPDGSPAAGSSSAPAISPDGRYVSFSSTAADLVEGDGNRKPDVFVRDLASRRTTRVSVSTRGRAQDKSSPRPFTQISDLSRNGRYVVFDSDATNLVRRDRNRNTDVFVRDRVAKTTRRVSLSTTSQESSGDSFFPTITPDGRRVAFSSLADDLVPEDSRGRDIFVRDIPQGTTVLADVGSRGQRRGRESTRALTERPAMTDDAAGVAFVSRASNLVSRDRNKAADVFLRRLEPAASAFASRRIAVQQGRVIITFGSRDRNAGPLRCRLDGGAPTLCPLGGTLLPRLRRGRHTLTALAGAPGSFYARRAIVVRMTVRKGRTQVRVHNPGDDS